MSWRLDNREVVAGAVVVLTLLCYLPAMQGGFVSDDHRYLIDNTRLTDLPFSALHRLFTKPMPHGEYLPLRDLSYRIDWALFGRQPLGYHLHNLVLYLLCCGAAWLAAMALQRALIGRQPSERRIAAATTILFAVHPAHVEAVAWISGRKDLLASFFVLLSLWLLVRAVEAPAARLGPLMLAYAACLAALLSKSLAVATPPLAALLLYRSSLRSHAQAGAVRRAAVLVAPMALMAALWIGASFWLYRQSGIELTGESAPELSLGTRSARALLILGHHVKVALLPVNLRLTYDAYPPGWTSWLVALGAATLGAAAVGLWSVIRRGSVAGFGVTLVPLFLLPYLHLVSYRTWSLVGERYIFLPVFGLALTVAWILRGLGSARPSPARAVALAVLAALGLALTAARARDWASADGLIRRNAESSPGYYYAEYLGIRPLLRDGEWWLASRAAERVTDQPASEALAHLVKASASTRQLENVRRLGATFESVLRLQLSVRAMASKRMATDPPYSALVNNLLRDARSLYASLLPKDPDHPAVNYNLGLLELRFGNFQESAGRLRAAIDSGSLPPSQLAAAWNNLGVALKQTGEVVEAIASFDRALETDEREWQAALNLAGLYRQQGDEARARALAQEMAVRARRAGVSPGEIARRREALDLD